MEIQLHIVRAGETEPALPDLQRGGQATHVVLTEEGTAGGRPSVTIISEDAGVAVELTYQLFDMINGALHGAFGPPSSPFEVRIP